MRPERAGFEVRLDRPVLAKDAGELAVVDGFDAVVVESLDQITKERVHDVIALAGPLPIEPLDSVASLLSIRQLRFGVVDALGRFAELPERLLAAVPVLVAGRCRTRHEDVRADIERSDVRPRRRRLLALGDRHRLVSAIRLVDVVVGEVETALLALPVRLTADGNPEPFELTEAVLVFELAADGHFEPGALAPADRVGVVANVGPQVASVGLVPPVARRADLLIGFLDRLEERPPSGVVDAGDLLSRCRPQDVHVLVVIVFAVPDILA